MNTGKKRFMSGKTLFMTTGLTVFAAVFLWQTFAACTPSGKIPADAKSDFELMAEAWNTIQAHYVDRAAVKPTAMTYGAISGMVDALGDIDHSTFLSPEEIKREEEFTKGRYKGIGVEIKMKDGHVTIVAPLDNSPAQKAGIQAGEIILAVDGQKCGRAQPASGGQTGLRTGGNRGEAADTRSANQSDARGYLDAGRIATENVTWIRLPGTRIDHLRITAFSEKVTQSLIKALKAIEREASQGIVLDLRNNPGGVLDECGFDCQPVPAKRKRAARKERQGADQGYPGGKRRRGAAYSHGLPGERRHRQCCRNRGRRAQGSSSRQTCRHQNLRYGNGAAGISALGRIGPAVGHPGMAYAGWGNHLAQGHRPRPGGAAGSRGQPAHTAGRARHDGPAVAAEQRQATARSHGPVDRQGKVVSRSGNRPAFFFPGHYFRKHRLKIK